MLPRVASGVQVRRLVANDIDASEDYMHNMFLVGSRWHGTVSVHSRLVKIDVDT